MINSDDYTEQTRVYLKNGSLWRVIGYCAEPSITMVNIATGEREAFGISGRNNSTFTPVDGLRYDHSKCFFGYYGTSINEPS